jgi:hypothetical protein
VIIRPLKKKTKTAVTTEELMWRFVAEQAKLLFDIANDKAEPARKKLVAGGPYNSLKNALRQLGAIK